MLPYNGLEEGIEVVVEKKHCQAQAEEADNLQLRV